MLSLSPVNKGQTSIPQSSHYPINMIQASHDQESPKPVKEPKNRRKWLMIVGGVAVVAVVLVGLFIAVLLLFTVDPELVKSNEELIKMYNLYAVEDPTQEQQMAFRLQLVKCHCQLVGNMVCNVQKYRDALKAAESNYLSVRQATLDQLLFVYQKMDALFKQNKVWSRRAQQKFNQLDYDANQIERKLVHFSSKCYDLKQKLFEIVSRAPANIEPDLITFLSKLPRANYHNIIKLKRKWDKELYGINLPYPVTQDIWRLIEDVDNWFQRNFPIAG